jgi:murein DD-endopeptidase MepM/ murein hydrolase activator NlpD
MLKVVTLKIRLIVAAVVVVALVLVTVIVAIMIVASGSGSSAQAAPACPPANTVPTAPGDALAEQLANAKIIDDTAAALGLSGEATRVAIIAAIGESSLINLDTGDNAINPDGSVADSAGLFQQQPKTGWGTAEQVRDPAYATTSFLIGKAHDSTGGLVSIAGWDSMEPTQAIHAVQINADPNHYAKYYSQADAIISQAGIDITRTALIDTGVPDAGDIGTDPALEPDLGLDLGDGCGTTGANNGTGAQPLDMPYNMTDNYGPRPVRVEGASTWHPALDLQNYPNPCGRPVYAVLAGTVTSSDRLTLSIAGAEGFTVSYLHTHKTERLVDVGQTVTVGQQIAVVGNEAPSTGCHVDIRMNVTGNTNPDVAALAISPVVAGYVNPEEFMSLFGITLCDATCTRNFDD